MRDVMFDLESMGNGDRPAIVAIGAVFFDLHKGELGERFYVNVDLGSCLDAGLEVSASTIYWWLEQDPQAQRDLIPDRIGIEDALGEFRSFIWRANSKGPRVWSHDSDKKWIRSAYQAVGKDTPWHFRCERDLRTLVALYQSMPGKTTSDWPEVETGTSHNALSDAEFQARYACEMVKFLRSGK